MDSSSRPPAYEVSERIARLNISARDEEGCEQLPPYHCSLSNSAVFRMKLEFLTPFEQAMTRKWERVYLSLHGTMLSIHRLKEPLFSKGKEADDPDHPAGCSAGRLIRKYTLQHAEVGVAVDYNKRSYVLRLRAEAEQFLISCMRIETMIEWLDCLGAAIDLALPLEDRRHPENGAPPRQRVTGPQRLIGEQFALIREHYPHLAAPAESSRMAVLTENVLAETGMTVPDLAQTIEEEPTETLSRVSTEITEIIEEESEQEGEKWAPQHTEVPPITRRYARRYLGQMLVNSKRKTPWVIYRGRRYYVNWSETRLTPWRKGDPVESDLPSYDSASKESRHEELALARIASASDGFRPAMIERI